MFERFPCRAEIPFALGVISGCACRDLPTSVAALCVTAAGFLFGRRTGAVMLAGLLLGAGSLRLHDHLGSLRRRGLPERRARIAPVLECTDARITRCPGLPPPGSFTARTRNGARIAVRPSDASPLPGYGELFTGSGVFTPSALAGRYGEFLSNRGIAGTWEAEELRTVSPAGCVPRTLCRVRDFLMERMLSGVSADRARVLAGTLFFGASGGFGREMRHVHLRAGTLHLFSISGMHIAAAAFLIFFLLRFLPYKAQYLCLACVMTLYALSTGANPPVVRALIVILLWCAGRIFLAGKSSLELLALAAALMFLHDPGLVRDTGTQYSFFITAVLILAGCRCGEIRRLDLACIACLPLSREALRLRRSRERNWRVFLAAAGCCAAFAAGIGISAAHRNLILPGAVFMNLLLLVLIPVLFLLGGLKLLLGPLLPGPIFGEALLSLDRLCAEGGRLMTPVRLIVGSDAEALLFCAALAAALSPFGKKLRAAAAATAVCLYSLWCVRPVFASPAAVFISGAPGVHPVIAVSEPAEGLGFIVNAGSPDMAAAAADFLASRGTHDPEALLFSSRSPNEAAGVSALLRSARPRRIRLPEGNCRALAEKLLLAGARDPASGGREEEFIKIFAEKNRGRLEYFDPGSKLRFCMEWKDTPGGRLLSVNGGPVRRILWGSEQETVVYGF